MLKCLIDWILEGTKLMTKVDEIESKVDEIDVTLDSVLQYVLELKEAGGGATPEQLDRILSKLTSVSQEAKDIVTPPETPTE